MNRLSERTQLLTRGAVAAEVGCNIETIRYYEQIGIMPPPPRSEGGHRLYGHHLIKRLHFIRRSRELGFSLREIRQLLRLVDGADCACAQVETLAREHAQNIGRQIADLKRRQAVLEAMASRCGGGGVPECPIIDALFETRTPGPSPRST